MDGGETPAPPVRKRTESIGGGSDSELSEGWNIIDQADVASHDGESLPSSDGESVEVIDAEEESRESITDTDVEGDTHLTPVTAVEAISESESPVVPQGTPREEMFDPSFRWFLIYATAAVLVSNLAFMVAENALAWTEDVNVDTPSFLRDFPTTPKLSDGVKLKNIPWAEKEDVIVEVIDDHHTDHVTRNSGSKIQGKSQSYEANRKQQYKQSSGRSEKNKNERSYKQPDEKYKQQHETIYKHHNEKAQHQNQKFNDNQMGKFLNSLGELTGSPETKDKLKQVFLILDALQIGLHDLDDIVTENSELQNVLKNQKHKLFQIVTEMEYGVTKSIDRVATHILNKVRKLERRFEHQWCELEKRGHQEQLKGLFYDCQEDEKNKHEFQGLKQPEETKPHQESSLNKFSNIDINLNSFQYQVDRDSPGKEHSNSHSEEIKEIEDYYVLVSNEIKNNDAFLKEKSLVNSSPNKENERNDQSINKEDSFTKNGDTIIISDNEEIEEKRYDSQNQKDKRTYHDDKRKQFGSREKYFEENPKYNGGKRNMYNERRKHKNENVHYNDKSGYNKEEQKQNDKKWEYNDQKSHFNEKHKNYEGRNPRKHEDRRTFSEEKRKYTERFESYKQNPNKEQNENRESHGKSEKSVPNSGPELIRKYLKESCEKGKHKLTNIYEKLKGYVDSKLRVPKEMFDSLYAKYCQVNDESLKWKKRYNREHPKGDFREKNNKNFFKDELTIGDDLNKNFRIIDITEMRTEKEAGDAAKDKFVVPDNQPRQWVFNADETMYDNKSNLTGDWFFKAGESRTKMRWSNNRSSWLFDRAADRRAQPRPSYWFSGRRKNWYFRRAWARQNCRHNPHSTWCGFSEEESLTVPHPSVNLR
ncbi:trichohyalin-like [Macrosteles quadrilineatus]|uniref:trichohyalin-like n=1 Tax=Macrosteles quadrilineatus TaxID=74068 RepID=UPI0023E15547|nr:trichohyalin-like [Macrosteles quadrilineatus]